MTCSRRQRAVCKANFIPNRTNRCPPFPAAILFVFYSVAIVLVSLLSSSSFHELYPSRGLLRTVLDQIQKFRAFFSFRTMSAVNITNVTVLDNPASFLTPFQFEISYECVTPLKDDLEWKLIYVGSAEDETYDQLLESVLVGPVNVGNYRFVLQADPPNPSKIREEDIIGVTVLLLTCSYLGQEFVRVGYYVNNDYDDEQLREEPPQKVLIDKVQRNILSDKPRVTKFPINFHPENSESGDQVQPPDHAAEADGNEERPSSPGRQSNGGQ